MVQLLPATNELLKSIEFLSTPSHTLGPSQTLAFLEVAVVHPRSMEAMVGISEEIVVEDDAEDDALDSDRAAIIISRYQVGIHACF